MQKITAVVFLLLITFGRCLEVGFYRESCPQAEDVVRKLTWTAVQEDQRISPRLLRLHFHDCFVMGCDVSILIDSSGGVVAEKDAIPNASLAGYEMIDQIKSRLEIECPNTVSCADILALAARDAVSFQFKAPLWEVKTGRKDGRVSLVSEALSGLPAAASNISSLVQNFEKHGLNITDLVALSGAHSLGVAHCFFMTNRLYNFTGHEDQDPSLDPEYAKHLKEICPLPVNPNATLPMVPGSSGLSSNYFAAVRSRRGNFMSDTALMTDPRTASLTEVFQDYAIFLQQFKISMEKMSEILGTGDGEIRKACRLKNP